MQQNVSNYQGVTPIILHVPDGSFSSAGHSAQYVPTLFAWLTKPAIAPIIKQNRAGASNTYPTPDLLKLPAVGLCAILHNSLNLVDPQQVLLRVFFGSYIDGKWRPEWKEHREWRINR
jgi:hypothetical protein